VKRQWRKNPARKINTTPPNTQYPHEKKTSTKPQHPLTHIAPRCYSTTKPSGFEKKSKKVLKKFGESKK
ncbi:MAG: hypothetical protein K2K00_11345, partial [Muribaculaceae bacterium]|nr:hypothetical protein [Muribaculaceae bacterium]